MSGVGKGIAIASIGKILQQYGFSCTAIKIDPYINIDAGTMRPTEHGEVWVTYDGGEIDQDLGNYERFLDISLSKNNNITTGKIYKALIEKERRGEFLGETVQFIPHVPNEIKQRVKDAGKGSDICLVEIGGTVGDYENIPFLFAMKSLEREIGANNIIYGLVTYLPVPNHMGEMKTKPTQTAIHLLTQNGIFPDFIMCRGPEPLDRVRKKKIEMYANIEAEYVISAPDVDCVYKIPLNFEQEFLGKKLLYKLGLVPKQEPQWDEWRKLVQVIQTPKNTLDIAIVGKYLDIGNYSLTDSYVSVKEALIHAGASHDCSINIHWVDSKRLETEDSASVLGDFDGIIVPGGFGNSGVEGKINAINYARIMNQPFLGLCYGMQLAVVEYSRNVCNLKDAHSTECNPDTSNPVIDLLPEQKNISSKGGTMRLGAYGAILKEETKVIELYRKLNRFEHDAGQVEKIRNDEMNDFRMGNMEGSVVLEIHRHRYEQSTEFVSRLEQQGLVFSGYHERKDGTRLMEFIELPNHPYFVATQSHPEFKSRLGNPAPLFYGFVEAALKMKTEKTNENPIVN